MKIQGATFILMTLSFLNGCGGGADGSGVSGSSSGGTIDPNMNAAEGFWTGTSSTGTTLNLAILENGDIFGVYTSTAGSYISGAVNGKSSGLGSVFSGTGNDYNFATGVVRAGSFTGTVAAKNSINAANFAGFGVSLKYNSDYETPATLASLAGTYLITGRSGRNIIVPGYVTVNAQGIFTNLENGCTRTGTFVPRQSGKNIYDLTVSTTGNCATFAGSTLVGVAHLDKSTVPYHFHSLALKADKSDGMVILGVKQ